MEICIGNFTYKADEQTLEDGTQLTEDLMAKKREIDKHLNVYRRRVFNYTFRSTIKDDRIAYLQTVVILKRLFKIWPGLKAWMLEIENSQGIEQGDDMEEEEKDMMVKPEEETEVLDGEDDDDGGINHQPVEVNEVSGQHEQYEKMWNVKNISHEQLQTLRVKSKQISETEFRKLVQVSLRRTWYGNCIKYPGLRSLVRDWGIWEGMATRSEKKDP